MRVAVLGATGRIGSAVVAEAQGRGHDLTAITRNPSAELPAGVERRLAEATDVDALAAALAGHDAAISALGGDSPERAKVVVDAAHALLLAVPRADVARLLVVGGAGSLRWPDRPDVDGVDLPERALASRRPYSLAQREALGVYREADPDLNWTYVSPADVIAPGRRTGRYTIGHDEFVVSEDGTSTISIEDFAVALVDELERGEFSRARFTVGYADADR